MPLSKSDFSKLVSLQDHDKKIDELRKSIGHIPEDIAAIRGEIEDEKKRLETVHDKAKQVQVRKKEKETEMAQREEAIKKHQQELNQVKTNDAFKALLKEIEDDKKKVGDLETEILELMDEADAVLKEEKVIKDDIGGFEKERNESIQILEKKKADLEAQVKSGDQDRAALSEGVDASLLKLYDQTRERRDGVAVAGISGKTCAVCHVGQTPQVLINVQKGTSIIQCDSCQRILVQLESSAA